MPTVGHIVFTSLAGANCAPRPAMSGIGKLPGAASRPELACIYASPGCARWLTAMSPAYNLPASRGLGYSSLHARDPLGGGQLGLDRPTGGPSRLDLEALGSDQALNNGEQGLDQQRER